MSMSDVPADLQGMVTRLAGGETQLCSLCEQPFDRASPECITSEAHYGDD